LNKHSKIKPCFCTRLSKAAGYSVILIVLLACASFNPAKTRRIISFSGYSWKVKNDKDKVGPGPNYFSDSDSSVWVDGQDRLHLRIRKIDGRWHCPEVICMDTLGYGSYIFEVVTPPDSIDPAAVLGLFTWSPEPHKYHHEIDIEISRWGNEHDSKNIQYVVQPFENKKNVYRFQAKSSEKHIHAFRWEPKFVEFGSKVMEDTLSFRMSRKVPYSFKTQARINLWLYKSDSPLHKGRNEVVISRFKFIKSSVMPW
jgi:hypothetical protein